MDWEVRIMGDPADLSMLAQACVGPDVAIIEHGSEFFLGSSAFEHLTDAGSVRDKAREIITSVGGCDGSVRCSSTWCRGAARSELGRERRQS